jgi:hypothetical protein
MRQLHLRRGTIPSGITLDKTLEENDVKERTDEKLDKKILEN